MQYHSGDGKVRLAQHILSLQDPSGYRLDETLDCVPILDELNILDPYWIQPNPPQMEDRHRPENEDSLLIRANEKQTATTVSTPIMAQDWSKAYVND